MLRNVDFVLSFVTVEQEIEWQMATLLSLNFRKIGTPVQVHLLPDIELFGRVQNVSHACANLTNF